MVRIFDRKTKNIYEDKQYGVSYLRFLYGTFVGRILLKVIICPWFSKVNGWYNQSMYSKKKISDFIKTQKIDMSLYENREYRSFNDFFIRKKKMINYDGSNNAFISPADSKVRVYKISDDLKINIKNSVYSLDELLKSKKSFKEFSGGNCLVFRLSVDDYHRYCFVDSGKVTAIKKINGVLHTVSSISDSYKVYSENSRICSRLATDNFGELIVVEVGALLVGKIHNHKIRFFNKGEENGSNN